MILENLWRISRYWMKWRGRIAGKGLRRAKGHRPLQSLYWWRGDWLAAVFAGAGLRSGISASREGKLLLRTWCYCGRYGLALTVGSSEEARLQ